MSRLISFITSTALVLGASAQESRPVWITAHADFIAGDGNAHGLARHAHDPTEDLYLQGIDLGLNFQPTTWLSGFVNVNTFETSEGLDAEWEEGFLTLQELPYGFQARGGRYLNRIGRQNNTHLHSWDFVDANLSTVYFLGDEGLVSEGLELTWGMELDRGHLLVSTSYGQALSHDEHGDEDHDEHEEEDHDEHEAGFSDDILTTRALLQYNLSDYHQNTLGLSHVTTLNGGADADLYGVDYTYTWRQNGLESGGKSLAVGGEYFAYDGAEGMQDSYLLSAIYGFGNGFSLGTRFESIDFPVHEEPLEYDEQRQRLSLALTYNYQFNPDWLGKARVQYNQDWLDRGDDQSSVWFQLGFSYGGAEVR